MRDWPPIMYMILLKTGVEATPYYKNYCKPGDPSKLKLPPDTNIARLEPVN